MKDGLQSYIMVLHAFTGCDTTSAIHTKGKISLMKKILTSTTVRAVMEVIKDPWANSEEVGTAGQKLGLQGRSCLYFFMVEQKKIT